MKASRLFVISAMASIVQFGDMPFGAWSGYRGQPGSPISMAASAQSVGSSDIEPIDGIGNNVSNPTWGSTGEDLIRLAPVGYADGIDSPSLPNNLSARAISN